MLHLIIHYGEGDSSIGHTQMNVLIHTLLANHEDLTYEILESRTSGDMPVLLEPVIFDGDDSIEGRRSRAVSHKKRIDNIQRALQEALPRRKIALLAPRFAMFFVPELVASGE